jgi:hypothetical protein
MSGEGAEEVGVELTADFTEVVESSFSWSPSIWVGITKVDGWL